MKFGKPSGDSLKDAAFITGGAFGGSMASNALVGAIHKPKAAAEDAAAVKKEQDMLLLKRGGIALVALAVMASVSGKDDVTTVTKGALLGMAVTQGAQIIKTLATRSGMVPGSGFMADAVGLGCNCSTNGLGYTPVFQLEAPIAEYMPALNAAYEEPVAAEGPFAA